MHEKETFLWPTEESSQALMSRNMDDPLVMLNLLRFREIADYSGSPALAPPKPISGEMAYGKYMEHTEPLLRNAGGEVLFLGAGGPYLIGPSSDHWDLILIVRYGGPNAFFSFTTNQNYLAGVGHRTAALEDSRLLPMSGTWKK